MQYISWEPSHTSPFDFAVSMVDQSLPHSKVRCHIYAIESSQSYGRSVELTLFDGESRVEAYCLVNDENLPLAGTCSIWLTGDNPDKAEEFVCELKARGMVVTPQ